MNHIGSFIRKIAGTFVIVFFVHGAAFPQVQMDEDVLLEEVKALIGKYQYLAGMIKADAEPDPARPFIQLFRNPRVLVYDDLQASGLITARDYAGKIKENFPQGLKYSIDIEKIKMGKVPEDDGSRLIIEVKAKKTVSGSFRGEDFTNTDRLVFMIGYEMIEGQYRNFLIHGINPLSKHDHDLIISASPSLSRIYNSKLSVSERFMTPWVTSWAAGLNYQYMINDSWGVGAGIGGMIFRHSLHLDRIDALNGHNPNIRDVEWTGEFSYLEVPVYGVYHINPWQKLKIELGFGVFAAYRLFEEISVTGVNSHTGQAMQAVISDPFEYQNISDFDFGLDVSLGVRIAISRKVSLFARTGLRHGLMPMDKDPGLVLPYGIYQGQYNPLFYKSGASDFSQSIPAELGLVFRVFGQNNF